MAGLDSNSSEGGAAEVMVHICPKRAPHCQPEAVPWWQGCRSHCCIHWRLCPLHCLHLEQCSCQYASPSPPGQAPSDRRVTLEHPACGHSPAELSAMRQYTACLIYLIERCGTLDTCRAEQIIKNTSVQSHSARTL